MDGDLTTLSLSFQIWKVGIITEPPLRVTVRMKQDNFHKALHMVLGNLCAQMNQLRDHCH